MYSEQLVKRVADAMYRSLDIPEGADIMTLRWDPLREHSAWDSMAKAALDEILIQAVQRTLAAPK